MTELKTWRENDTDSNGEARTIFKKERILEFSSCDMDGKMHIAELLALTSNLAVEDFEDRDLSYKFLYSKGFALLLSRISYKVIKMPNEAEELILSTWEEKSQGLQMVRKFAINDRATSEELILGTTMWLNVDPNARRILPPTKFDLRPVPQNTSELRTLEPGKIKISENAKIVQKRLMNFSDCDPNGHVNNSRYGAFALDALLNDSEIRNKIEGKSITDFRLNYAKEAHAFDTLSIFAEITEHENGKVIATVCGKNDSSENNEVSFECEMYLR